MLPLRSALGRVLASDVVSHLNVPAHDNSAMDGYAFAGRDLAGDADTVLQVAGSGLAGIPFSGQAGAGQCVRIMTGAVLPARSAERRVGTECVSTVRSRGAPSH